MIGRLQQVRADATQTASQTDCIQLLGVSICCQIMYSVVHLWMPATPALPIDATARFGRLRLIYQADLRMPGDYAAVLHATAQ